MTSRLVISLLSCYSFVALAQFSPSPRWAQAVSLLDDTLYVHGGLSDPFNSYTYNTAPELSDLLILDLSVSFNSSSPPWQLFSAESSPAIAWHTLSAFSTTELLLFGGQPGPNSQEVLTTLNDSSGLLSTSGKSGPFFLMEPQNWKNEPMRRIRHSSSYMNGNVWIIGGEKADGSGNAFNQHYAFSPSGPEFIQLPSNNAPPDIYGHASLALPDGRLLVLGGYCASCAELVPMNTAWSLNTTTTPPVWEVLSISSEVLPTPRRDFAAVVLATGQILIHGGGDSQLQTTYSDGWILDTGQNPMVWNAVAVLTQLGERKDHLAVQAGGYVLFCFGYGSSSPASATLFIYDPTTSSMVTSYNAPSRDSTPTITASGPTQTGLGPNPNSITSAASSGGTPGVPSYTSGSSASANTRTIAVALGTAFGILGLVAAGLGTLYYVKRIRSRNIGASEGFFSLRDGPESSEDGSVGGSEPEAARTDYQDVETGRTVDGLSVVTGVLAHLGINKFGFSAQHPRKDMFADEDTRSFGWVGSSGAVHREGSGGTSAWSLRSVGVLVRGVIGREPGGSEADQASYEWEKMDNLRREDQDGLARQGSRSAISSHPARRKDASSFSYTDPFQDPLSDDDYYDLQLRSGAPEKDADYDNYAPRSDETDISEWPSLSPHDSIHPFPEHSFMLTPLREASRTSLTEASDSLPSLQESPRREITISCHVDNVTSTQPASASPTSYSPTLTRSSDPHIVPFVPRYSIVSSSSSHSPSISRHDGWWTRITKSPFLDRRTSFTSSKPVDFRDPTPAPPLSIRESKNLSDIPGLSDDTLVDIAAGHGRSVSSAHSGRTANTNSAEHLGGSYDVVQRLASDGSSSRRAPSLGSAEITEQGIFTNAVGNPAPAEGAPSSYLTPVDPPRSAPPSAVPTQSIESETPAEPLMLPQWDLSSPKRGVTVSNKVRAYERRLSQELESQKTPAPRNTRRREEVPSRSRPTIQYGVAPRPSLFIANPDLGHLS